MYKTSLAVNNSFLIVFGLLLILQSCTPKQEVVEDIFQPRYDHEAYKYKLDQLGVLTTAIGLDWLKAAQSALYEPMIIEAPFSEDFYVDRLKASGTGYRFSAMRGHRVEISLSVEQQDSSILFLDIFRVDSDSLNQYSHIASLNDSLMQIVFEPQNDANYVVRFQTELMRGGRFNIRIIQLPSLAFPVSGKDKSAIGSLFGAPRDAGRRVHHGIDIFSRRHTPIIAPCNGFIRSTKDNELGGKVVWLNDRQRRQTLYFAHLEDVLVEEDTYVTAGDTIGTVGNSGNARTTAPHLHFGIYSSGPIDPYHFVVETKTRFKRNLADQELIGKTVRTNHPSKLRVRNTMRKGEKIDLEKHQIVHIKGTSAAYYHVVLPDQTEGYLAHTDIENIDRPIRKIVLTESTNILDSPIKTGVVTKVKHANSILNIIGVSKDSFYTLDENGMVGWVGNSI